MKDELSVDFEIGFSDSNILSYCIQDENLTLLLECWNLEILEIKFLRISCFLAMNFLRIADLREIFESELIERVFNELYDEKPKKHNLRVFKFVTASEATALEIVCEDITIKKIKRDEG